MLLQNMKACPHCAAGVKLNELPHQGVWKNVRICPHCGGAFTPDPDTKFRQGLCIVVAIIALIFTLLLYYESNEWLAPALLSYFALAALLYWGNKKMYLVPSDKG
ncbi:MAG: hypothetical protein R3276_04065 [Marinobacter sp.]|nr:hypothetical protein [Marinobacter sp.]